MAKMSTGGSFSRKEFEIKAIKGLQKLLVFPRGTFFIEKYQEWVTFDDAFFTEIISAYNNPTFKKPFLDKNHELKESYGSFSNPTIEEDGLYFDLLLTEEGFNLIQSGTYTSISPTFGEITDTNKIHYNNCLVSVSLTNIPALQGNYPELQEQLELEQGYKNVKYFNYYELNENKKGGQKMRNLESILRKLELSPEASDSAISEAIQKLIDEGASKEQLIASLQKKIAEVQAMADESKAAADEAKATVDAMKEQAVQAEFEVFFSKAVEGGQVLVAEKQKYLSLFKSDKDFAISTMKKLSGSKMEGMLVSSGSTGLSEEDFAIMKSFDMNPSKPEDVEKYKKLVGGK